ncbi:M20/M25/M40 family metallo-hydrolase [Litorimonas sp. RW-G-Af-16]|uniref:M20/M25/M40 family metallo-hydrolase n=1 Tax=Litorimonas sp. RW-G-Af-16 TaxID=3241168 RepID=UPI00390C443C
MKHFLLATCATILLVGCANEASDTPKEATKAEQPAVTPEVQKLIETAKNGSHAYDIVESLTTEIGPRLAGTDAEARARDWAVAKFKEIGLENVRVQPFTIPGWERGEETASIVAPYAQQLYITSLGGSVATPSGGITAPIAFFPTFEDLEAAPAGGLDGKIVFISGRMEKAPDGAGYGPANRKRRSGATEAAKRGAVAVVIRSVGTDSHRFPHTGQMRYAEDTPKIPIAALSAPDADQLERVLSRGEKVTIKMTLTPRVTGDRPSGNIIGEIIGSESPEEIVLISGHLDSWDLGTGAIDDGAGIGISAGASQVILEAGLKPKRTIRVVAFGAEEVGLLGGFAYVDANRAELDNHVLATESDFGATAPYEVQSGVSAGEDVLKQIADATGLPMSDVRTNGGPDIGPMSREGVPTMRFQQDGTDYFDLHHTPDDTLDKIKPEDMATNAAAFAVMAWMASEADTNFRDTSDSASTE